MEHVPENKRYTLRNFYPLIAIFSLIIAITVALQIYSGWNVKEAMRIFMSSFFLIFGFFKVINLQGFAKAYAMYDLIAKQYLWYGYIYPFFELGLGIAYLFNWYPVMTNIATFFFMVISAAGVFNELRQKRHIVCGCLGTVFKLPMTYVTLTEDLLMAIMALAMLLI